MQNLNIVRVLRANLTPAARLAAWNFPCGRLWPGVEPKEVLPLLFLRCKQNDTGSAKGFSQ